MATHPPAKTWRLLPHDHHAVDRLARTLRLPPLVAHLLLNRGVEAPEQIRQRMRVVDLVGAIRADQQQGRVRRLREQTLQQRAAGRVAPLQVVEREHQRMLRSGAHREEAVQREGQAGLGLARPERWDRGRKAEHYRGIPSLQEYLLVSQDAPRIEQYRRHGEREWVLMDAIGMEERIELASIGCALALRDVYARVF